MRSEMEPIDIELLSKMQLRIDNKQISCTERTNRKCTVSINITLMFYSAQNPFSSSIYRSFISHLLVMHRCISLFRTRILYFLNKKSVLLYGVLLVFRSHLKVWIPKKSNTLKDRLESIRGLDLITLQTKKIAIFIWSFIIAPTISISLASIFIKNACFYTLDCEQCRVFYLLHRDGLFFSLSSPKLIANSISKKKNEQKTFGALFQQQKKTKQHLEMTKSMGKILHSLENEEYIAKLLHWTMLTKHTCFNWIDLNESDQMRTFFFWTCSLRSVRIIIFYYFRDWGKHPCISYCILVCRWTLRCLL